MKCANFECNPMQGWSLCGWMGRDIFDAKFQKRKSPPVLKCNTEGLCA